MIMFDNGDDRDSGRGTVSHQPAVDIAGKLKSFYQSVEDEPVPDHLMNLLEKLDEAERAQNANRDK
ncbi:hypothetical protein DFR52_102697 [Hoeflea marina]|uniref:Anti-sigma factor NepR domain-containing protein n=1 Tax=Hoeflea marina TaxID=274592 RepID=A0A317PMB7_9HYPH|nr:NepR family anti-sigma factor [Hoeflea marina]PWW02032.1 hypothetical protein DFR52_102697 [Hoeflea marina]